MRNNSKASVSTAHFEQFLDYLRGGKWSAKFAITGSSAFTFHGLTDDTRATYQDYYHGGTFPLQRPQGTTSQHTALCNHDYMLVPPIQMGTTQKPAQHTALFLTHLKQREK